MIILNNRPFNTIIVDLDGPLLEGKQKHYQCYVDILQEFNFIPVSMELYWSLKRQRVDRVTLLQKSGAADIYDLFLQKWLMKIETLPYLSFDNLQPAVLEILAGWQQLGVRLLLATMRNNSNNLFWQLEQLSLLPFFDEVIIVGNLDGNTSKANAVKPFLQKSELTQCLWIGDTEVDLHSANELRIETVLLGCGLRTEEYLQSLQPNYLFATLQDVYMKTKRVGNINLINNV